MLDPSTIHLVSILLTSTLSITFGLLFTDPIAVYLGAPGYPELLDLRVDYRDILAVISLVIITLFFVLVFTILTHVMCGCEDCDIRLRGIEDAGIITYQYLSFPVRYILDIPCCQEYDGSWRWGVGKYWIRRSGRPTRTQRDSYGGFNEWTDIHGLRHRNGDLPAFIGDDVYIWYRHGLRHRDRGPAVISSDRTLYLHDDILHNDDDIPAYSDPHSTRWYINGRFGRMDHQLPALVYHHDTHDRYDFYSPDGYQYNPRIMKL